jgi:hypothetical protein
MEVEMEETLLRKLGSSLTSLWDVNVALGCHVMGSIDSFEELLLVKFLEGVQLKCWLHSTYVSKV